MLGGAKDRGGRDGSQASAPRRFAIRSRRIVTPLAVVDGAVVVDGGTIESVVRVAPKGIDVYDALDYAVLPGLVDTHVHVNEPGRTDWEGYETATRAAAAGGITTIVDMPLNCIPVTTSLAAFETKLLALPGKLRVDCGFYGGMIPGNFAELEPMARRGVLGFKSFMVHSGIDEFPNVTPTDLATGMPVVARTGVPLLVHAELEAALATPLPAQRLPEPYARYLASRPSSWEENAIDLLIDRARATGCRTHVVHLSASGALAALKAARASGAPITAETCPHYLTFTAETIADGDTRFKCSPPIREEKNRERLWDGLKAGELACVVSDHSPCAPHLKLRERGDFEAAWGGISGLQIGLAATWSGARSRGVGLAELAAWMATGPAALVGLSATKGRIAAGLDADFAIFSPERRLTVSPQSIHHKHKITPYEGLELFGGVEATFVRGQIVYERGEFPGAPIGRPILRASR